jgi:hypothetical protein
LFSCLFAEMTIMFQPCSGPIPRKHEKATLSKLVDFEDPAIWNLLTMEQQQRLKELFPAGKARFWGNLRGKNNYNLRSHAMVDRVEAGFEVAFVKKQVVYLRGEIEYAFHNPGVAMKIWGADNETGQTWEYIYAVDNLVEVNIPFGRTLCKVTRMERYPDF